MLLDTHEEVLKLRTTAETEIKEQRQELTRIESRHLQREEQLESKIEAHELRLGDLANKENDVAEARKEVEELKEQIRQKDKQIQKFEMFIDICNERVMVQRERLTAEPCVGGMIKSGGHGHGGGGGATGNIS